MADENNKPRRSRSIFRELGIMLIIAFILIGGFFGANFLLKITMGTDTPLVVVSSGSMEPNLNVGDICLIQNRNPAEIQVGDIIVFEATWLPANSLPVIHRVIDISEIDGVYYFVTQGDNQITNPFPDPASTPETNVLGVVIFTAPRIGIVILWLNEGNNYLLITGILVSLIVITFIWDYSHPENQDEFDDENQSDNIDDDVSNPN